MSFGGLLKKFDKHAIHFLPARKNAMNVLFRQGCILVDERNEDYVLPTGINKKTNQN